MQRNIIIIAFARFREIDCMETQTPNHAFDWSKLIEHFEAVILLQFSNQHDNIPMNELHN